MAEARALGRAFLQAQGLADGFIDAIHPDDEMFLTIADYPGAERSRQAVEYLLAGHEALTVLEAVLAHAGRRLGELDALLEFACGYGRFTRYLARELSAERIHSAEILPGAVAFVGETFGVRALTSATDPAALVLPRRYPLIWVGSLFSHLPRARFAAWLARHYEALSDDGLLVFSTHGAGVLSEVPKDSSGFTFVPRSESRHLDVQEYGTTFVTPSVLAEIATECGVAHLQGVERDLWWIQDVWVASRRDLSRGARRERSPFVRGAIDHLKLDAAGQAWIGGWTLIAAHDAPLRSVALQLDGQEIARCELGEPAAAPELLPGCVSNTWRMHGEVGELPAGVHRLAAVATARSGRPYCIDVRALDHAPGRPHLFKGC